MHFSDSESWFWSLLPELPDTTLFKTFGSSFLIEVQKESALFTKSVDTSWEFFRKMLSLWWEVISPLSSPPSWTCWAPGCSDCTRAPADLFAVDMQTWNQWQWGGLQASEASLRGQGWEVHSCKVLKGRASWSHLSFSHTLTADPRNSTWPTSAEPFLSSCSPGAWG